MRRPRILCPILQSALVCLSRHSFSRVRSATPGLPVVGREEGGESPRVCALETAPKGEPLSFSAEHTRREEELRGLLSDSPSAWLEVGLL